MPHPKYRRPPDIFGSLGGADASVILDEGHSFDVEVVLVARLFEKSHIATSACPEVEVLSDNDCLHTQGGDQDLADELLRCDGRELRGERYDENHVDAEVVCKSRPFVQADQLPWCSGPEG